MKEAKVINLQQKRDSILEAAIQEFRAKGYDGASMDRIAELANASKRTVYNHFPSKDDLFLAVVDKFSAMMLDFKQVIYDSNRDLREQLYAFADAELALTTNPTWTGFIQVLLSLFLRNSELAVRMAEKHSPYDDTLTHWMQCAANDGKLNILDARQAANIYAAMLSGAFTWPVMYQGHLDGDLVQKMKRELVETFLARYQKK